jgi:microcystin-dependent protein
MGVSSAQNNPVGFIPAGCVMPYAGASAPAGWLLCAGQAVSRIDYGALFAVVGTTYGSGDGSTTFNLPDLRGRVIAGEDDMGGTAANRLTSAGSGINGLALGAAGGAQTMTISSSNLPVHQHSINHDHGSFNATSGGMSANASHSHSQVFNGAPTGGALDGTKIAYGTIVDNAWRNVSISSTNTDHTHTTTIDVPNFTGSSGDGGFANSATNNVQPTMVMNYIIKAVAY